MPEPLVSYDLVVIITIVCAVVFLALLPVVNIILGMLIFAKPDPMEGEQVTLQGNSSEALSKAYIRENKLFLQRANGVHEAKIDVIFYGKGKKKKSYVIEFNGVLAMLDPNFQFDKVKIIVLKVDGRLLNKKKIGYPNNIVNIVTSIGFVIGIGAPCFLHALYHSVEIIEASPSYIIYYLLPIVIGIGVGIAHYFLVRVVTHASNR